MKDKIIVKPKIKAIIGEPLTDEELENLFMKELEIIRSNPKPIKRSMGIDDKLLYEEIEKINKELPKDANIRFYTGIYEFLDFINQDS